MTLRERISNWLMEPAMHEGAIGLVPLDRPKTMLRDYSALFSVAYLACAQKKAVSLGALPAAVYRRTGKSSEPMPDHPVSRMLNGMANDLMSGRDLRHWMEIRRETFGDAYIWVEWFGGEPVGLWPITSQVDVDFDRRARPGRRVRYIVHGDTTRGGKVTVPAGNYFAEEVVHVRTPISKDGVHGESRARMAAEEIGLSVDLERFYASMLTNGNHQLGHVEIPQGKITEAQLESLKRAVDAKSGVDHAGKTPIFGYGAKWVTDQQTMKDAGLIEQQQWVLQQVCRVMNVPPSKVFDLSSSTYSSAESARVDYATETVSPEAVDFETALTPVLESMGDGGCYVKLNLNALMRGDSAARGQFYREMVYMGAMTRQEVREKEDLNPIPGLDKPLVPMNYGILEPDGSVTALSGDAPADGSQTGVTG